MKLKQYIANYPYKSCTKRTYAISNEFGLVAIAYADDAQEALDFAVDADLMGGHIMDLAFLTELPADTVFAGNYGYPINTDYLRIEEIRQRQ